MGRSSVAGGIWVAHPDVDEPERVIIRNPTNGTFVIGALFRREREIPGPRLQTSSDAANALGMLAGAPVKLDVTALRRETVDETPQPQEEIVAASLPEGNPIAETALDPIAGAAAAIEASDATDAAARTTQPVVQSAVYESKPRKGFLAGLFKPKKAEPTADAIEVASTDPSDALLSSVDKNTAAAPAVAAAAAPATPKPPKLSLDKPYIQIGIFSIEANAERTAKQMRNAGMVPTIRQQELNGKAFWRVIVGPAMNRSERSALLKSIKTEGFSDAYAVSN